MIARIAIFEPAPETDDRSLREFRSLLSSQAGCHGIYHLDATAADRALSLSFWRDEAAWRSAERAIQQRIHAGRGLGFGPNTVAFYEVLE